MTKKNTIWLAKYSCKKVVQQKYIYNLHEKNIRDGLYIYFFVVKLLHTI